MRRVARLWRCGKFISDVLKVFIKRPKYIGTDVAPQDKLAIRGYGDNQVRKLNARGAPAGRRAEAALAGS